MDYENNTLMNNNTMDTGVIQNTTVCKQTIVFAHFIIIDPTLNIIII